MLLGDESAGTAITITFWDSAEALQASEQAGQQLRRQAAEAGGMQSAPTVEQYEVDSYEMT